MKYKMAQLLRLVLQCVSPVFFVLLLAKLSYPLGSQGALLQWFSRLDPWLLLSQLRWQHAMPTWGWLALVVLTITLLAGRVFCGWLCPFGALLEFVDKVGRAVFKNMPVTRTKILPALQPVRYYWLLFIAAVVLLGSNWVLSLTPFALFSHEIVRVLQGYFPWTLALITVATLFYSRLWCSIICPTGVLLSLIARRRSFGSKIAGDCVRCERCTTSCTVGSSPADSSVTKEWCLACGRCYRACPTKAISWIRLSETGKDSRRSQNAEYAATNNQPSRRQFFKVAFTIAVAISFWEKTSSATKQFLRPPGALAELDFRAVCNRCGRCIQVCPSKALWPVPITAGLGSFETPYIIPRKAGCTLCMTCQAVCPTGAISQVVSLKQIRMGKASINKSRCLTWSEKTLCFSCKKSCPVRAIASDGQHRPSVLLDKCVGCGVCENACPVTGEAAIQVLVI